MAPPRRREDTPCRRAPAGGFTLVELITASMITSAVLLGIYAVFHQAIDSETRLGRRWADRQAAGAVVAHLADAMLQSVCPSTGGLSAITAGPDAAANGWALTCLTLRPTGGMERLRYTWSPSQADDRGMPLRLQRAIYAGNQNLSETSSSQAARGVDDWEHSEPMIIAKRLRSLSVQFREAGKLGAPWQDKWQGLGGRVIVRIRAQVGDQVAEKVLLPPVTGPLKEQAQDEPSQEPEEG